MGKKKSFDIIVLQCKLCNMKNYTVNKSKSLKEKFELNKYCSTCKKHTEHKETKV